MSCCSCRWSETTSLNYGKLLVYYLFTRGYMSMESHGEIISKRENGTNRRKPSPSASLPSTNHTYTGPNANSNLRGEKPACNCLSHGTEDQLPSQSERWWHEAVRTSETSVSFNEATRYKIAEELPLMYSTNILGRISGCAATSVKIVLGCTIW
jgi:hypothetical protein